MVRTAEETRALRCELAPRGERGCDEDVNIPICLAGMFACQAYRLWALARRATGFARGRGALSLRAGRGCRALERPRRRLDEDFSRTLIN